MRRRGHTAELKLRLPEELRQEIEAAAESRDVSMNTEMVRRLNTTFTEERALGSPEMVRLASMVAAAFKGAARMYAPGSSDPTVDREAYRRGAFAALDAMLAAIPDITPEEIALEIEGLKGRLLTRVVNEQLAKADAPSPQIRRRRSAA